MEIIRLMNDRNVILRPHCVVEVGNILKHWAEEWNEKPEECTEKWQLMDICLMDDGDAALLFRFAVEEYIGNINDRVRTRTVCNMYRVTVFNVDDGFKAQYRFRVQAGYATHVYFIDGVLFASVYSFGSDYCTLLHMWPGSDDMAQKHMGKYSVFRVVTKDGKIYTSHGNHDKVEDGKEWPVLSVYEDGKLRTLLSTDSFQGIDKIHMDEEGRIYGVTSDGTHGLIFKDGEARILKLPFDNAIDMALGNDGNAMYIVTGKDNNGCDCYRVPFEKDGEVRQKIAIEYNDEIIGHFAYCVIGNGIGAAYINGVVYLFDLV